MGKSGVFMGVRGARIATGLIQMPGHGFHPCFRKPPGLRQPGKTTLHLPGGGSSPTQPKSPQAPRASGRGWARASAGPSQPHGFRKEASPLPHALESELVVEVTSLRSRLDQAPLAHHGGRRRGRSELPHAAGGPGRTATLRLTSGASLPQRRPRGAPQLTACVREGAPRSRGEGPGPLSAPCPRPAPALPFCPPSGAGGTQTVHVLVTHCRYEPANQRASLRTYSCTTASFARENSPSPPRPPPAVPARNRPRRSPPPPLPFPLPRPHRLWGHRAGGEVGESGGPDLVSTALPAGGEGKAGGAERSGRAVRRFMRRCRLPGWAQCEASR